MEAVTTRERGIFEQTVHLMEGRCSRAAHIIKMEIKDNPDKYSRERREKIGTKVHNMQTKCKSSDSIT
jgi:hypothetical protein